MDPRNAETSSSTPTTISNEPRNSTETMLVSTEAASANAPPMIHRMPIVVGTAHARRAGSSFWP